MNKNKKEALDRIKILEKETAELRKIIEAPETLFDRIKNMDDVYNELGVDNIDNVYRNFSKKVRAIMKIELLENLFNGSWKANFKNGNQEKWFPYFTYGSGGLGFYCSSYYSTSYASQVGYFKDRETSDFIGRTFLSVYKDMIE